MDGSHSINSQGEVRSSLRCWIVAGLLLLAGVVGMSILSGRLSALKPGSERPLHLFAACRKTGRLLYSSSNMAPYWTTLAAAVLKRVPAIKDAPQSFNPV